MTAFVDRHGLWSDDQARQAQAVLQVIESGELDVVRFAWPDQHGLLRGKTLVADEARSALRNGVRLTSTLLGKDTSHKTVFPVFTRGGGFGLGALQGGADFTIVPDPSTFRRLPWAPRTGWLLCDAYLADGQVCPFATRPILQHALTALAGLGFDFVAGLEVEFHVFKLDDPKLGLADAGQPGEPPRVSLLSQGFQYLTELRYDRVDSVMELLRSQLLALGLPLRTLEVEFGPSQFELTFGPTVGTEPADTMVLLRSAIKQVCQRAGLHATFMCRPRMPQVMSSGWHLHQSLRRRGDGRNAFMPQDAGRPLSETGLHYLAGLKQHARGAAVLACPTINGYRRYRPMSLAPDRAAWAHDNRGAMLRVIGGADDPGSRIENRVGEPAANPYLYLASQVLSGLDGLQRRLDPGPSADAPYETPAEPLPRSLPEALDCLREDAWLCERLGPGFVDYYCRLKQAETDRFNLEVSEWEQREYFDLF
ncbi:glutamine synthetase family protein [Aquabacterium sp. J223]|uniref:glutamine synthetase family protein n=1 Tax=Aquabacterium sp. J223 TaxID=2898431 RepID=UPI0021AD672C|nr:glutamine synthetase family protein [Aquabacterium sp. J223]UUX96163.1 glutamine synthetase family protein [Aquabacterium sp. J223]